MEGLPAELLQRILDYISTKEDLSSIRLSSLHLATVAKERVFQKLTFKAGMHSITDQELIYCKYATFELGDEDEEYDDWHWDEDVDARLASIEHVAVTASGDKILEILARLPNVRKLGFRGNRQANIRLFAKPAHGFRFLETLHLENTTMRSLDLPRFATFLQYPTVKVLLGSPIIPRLPRDEGFASLHLSSIELISSILPYGDACQLIQACKSLTRFKFHPGDGMPNIDSVNPHQLATILRYHESSLRHLDIDYGLLDESFISLPAKEPWIIGAGLVSFSTLIELNVHYDVLFGGNRFGNDSIKLPTSLLPQTIRTTNIRCGGDKPTMDCIRLVVHDLLKHPGNPNMLTIYWSCSKDKAKPDIAEFIAQNGGTNIYDG